MTHSQDHSLSGWILLLLISCLVSPAPASRYSPSRPIPLRKITADSPTALYRPSAASSCHPVILSSRKLDFLYDTKGRRTARTISTWTGTAYQVTDSRKFLYDGWKLVAEINATNNLPIRSYTWLGNELVELVQDGVSYLPGYDANGNLTALKKRNGHEIMARYEYGPFGILLKASGPMAMENPIRFSSEYQDPITGLIYYGYRYYNPATQRWLSRDPIGMLGGYNLYALANNDPVNGRDYLGLFVLDEDGFPLMATGTAKDSYLRDPEVNEAIKRAEQREIEEMKDVGASLARLAASFAPGAGETMDGCTIVDPAASDFDKYMAAASLAINGATGGIFPNYSALRQCRKLDIDDATKLHDAGRKLPTIRNAHLAGKIHPRTGIPFDKSGFPDFSSVATHTAKIDQTGNRARDFDAANLAVGIDGTPRGFTWHHHQDGTTMQLVPTDIHRATGHTGGVGLRSGD